MELSRHPSESTRLTPYRQEELPACGTCLGTDWRTTFPWEGKGDFACTQCHGSTRPFDRNIRTIGIDPGLTTTGVGIWDGGSMTGRYIRTSKKTLEGRIQQICDKLASYKCKMLVVEKPQIYAPHKNKKKADPMDLAHLSLLAGAIFSTIQADEKILVAPGTWKGQTPKRIHHQRILKQIHVFGSHQSDALDAVGLCLWGLQNA